MVTCEFCVIESSSYRGKKSFKRHIQSHHKETPQQCSQFNQTFETSKWLEWHRKSANSAVVKCLLELVDAFKQYFLCLEIIILPPSVCQFWQILNALCFVTDSNSCFFPELWLWEKAKGYWRYSHSMWNISDTCIIYFWPYRPR